MTRSHSVLCISNFDQDNTKNRMQTVGYDNNVKLYVFGVNSEMFRAWFDERACALMFKSLTEPNNQQNVCTTSVTEGEVGPVKLY